MQNLNGRRYLSHKLSQIKNITLLLIIKTSNFKNKEKERER